jgi:hypothetical protein
MRLALLSDIHGNPLALDADFHPLLVVFFAPAGRKNNQQKR